MTMITAQDARDRTDIALHDPVRAELRLIEESIVYNARCGIGVAHWHFCPDEFSFMQEVIDTLISLGYRVEDIEGITGMDSTDVSIAIYW